MRYRIVILSAALIVSSLAATALKAATVKNGCTAGPVSVSGSSNKVSIKGECYKAGHTIPTIVRYGYTQSDDAGALCGSVTGKTGRSFIPKIAGTYAVRVAITVGPAGKNTGIRPRKLTANLVLSDTQLQCGQVVVGHYPTIAQLCDFELDRQLYTPCGSVWQLDTSIPSQTSPMWSSKPRLKGLVVLAPSLISPSGNCQVKNALPASTNGTMMGQPQQAEYWHCSDGFSIFPRVDLQFIPTDGSPACTLSGLHDLLYGGEYTKFSLPPDSAQWGGELRIIWKMQANKDLDTYVNNADKSVTFSGGSGNACNELGVHNAG